MQEIELKCQIPEGGRDAVHQTMQRLATQTGQALGVLPLRAAYFDTPARALAGQRMALRVRQEGDSWVQTLKAAGSTTLVRVEDNQPLAPPDDPTRPQAELNRHPEGSARDALRAALGWDAQADPLGLACGLVALYQTDIRRTHLSLDWPWSPTTADTCAGRVELALDEGWIGAGAHRLAVCELEIESVDGDPQAVIEAVRWFVQQHGLWLDTRTKAHRGGLLADRAFGPAPAKARPPTGAKPDLAKPPAQQVADDLAAWMEALSHLGAWDTVAAGWPALPDAQADAQADGMGLRAHWQAVLQALSAWQPAEALAPIVANLGRLLALAQPPEALTTVTAPAWARSPAPTLASLAMLSALLAAQAA